MTRTTPRRAMRPGRGTRRVVTAGLVALAVGLALLGWSIYDVLWRSPVDVQAAAAAVSSLRAAWDEGTDPLADEQTVESGEPVAVLSIPSLGDAEWPILVGTSDETLDRGLGWYDGTAAPGAVGNCAVAGIGDLHGPFADLESLQEGDQVVIETKSSVLTFSVTNVPAESTVADIDTWVIQPVPGQPEVAPTESLLTLTTDGGIFRTNSRTIVWASLTDSTTK